MTDINTSINNHPTYKAAYIPHITPAECLKEIKHDAIHNTKNSTPPPKIILGIKLFSSIALTSFFCTSDENTVPKT